MPKTTGAAYLAKVVAKAASEFGAGWTGYSGLAEAIEEHTGVEISPRTILRIAEDGHVPSADRVAALKAYFGDDLDMNRAFTERT